MLLIPGIYKVVGNRGCNCYIIETGAGLVVIDSGLLGSDTAIRRYIEMQLDATTEDIIYIIVTHAHRDVAESVPDLLSYSPNAQLVIHKADIEAFKRIAFMPEDIELVIIEDRHTLEDADIEIHHAPGHTAGSIVAKYDRALFCGDVVYIGARGFELPRQNYDRKLLMETLKKIAEMQFNAIFPAHGRHIIGNADRKLREFIGSLGI